MLPVSVFAESFKIGNIYYFKNPKITSAEPHPHVCVGIKDQAVVFLICGTSQFEKKKRYFELNDIAYETLVWVQPDPLINQLTKDTYINCNDIIPHNFIELHGTPSFNYYGVVSESELFQIKNGIEISTLIEEEFKKDLLSQFPEF
jgi:hypothetical protein